MILKRIKNYLFLRKLRKNKVYYVGSSNMLPPPLSKEEELEYLKKSFNGDNKAKDKLIEHNLRLVVFLAKKYENTGYDIEDLVSIGSIGLIKGINTYKIDKNIKLFPNYHNYIIICKREITNLSFQEMENQLIRLLNNKGEKHEK